MRRPPAMVLLAALTGIAFAAFVAVSVSYSSYVVASASMEPSIDAETHILVSRFDDSPAGATSWC